MISKTDILKMISHVYRRSQGRRDTRLMHPHREWILILLSFTAVLASGSIYSAGTFLAYQNIDAEVEHASLQTVKYRDEYMKDLLEYYDARSARFQALRGVLPTDTPGPTPSLVIEVPVVATTSTSSSEIENGGTDSLDKIGTDEGEGLDVE